MARSVDSHAQQTPLRKKVQPVEADLAAESAVVERAPDVEALVQETLQGTFGNAIVQAALDGAEVGGLGKVLAGEIAATAAGMGAHSEEGTGLLAAGNAALAKAARQAQGGTMGEAQALNALRGGGGQQLPTGIRAQMESAFGRSFAGVRIHTETDAAAKALGADAVAMGSHLHFGEGQYDPSSTSGKALIAHELTHVVQAAEGRLPGVGGVSNTSMAAEREAYANESLVMGAALDVDAGVDTSLGADVSMDAGLSADGFGSSVGIGSFGAGLGMGSASVAPLAGLGPVGISGPSEAASSAPAMLRETDAIDKEESDTEASARHEVAMGLGQGFSRAIDMSQGDRTVNVSKEGTGRRDGVFTGPSQSGHLAVEEYNAVMRDIGPDGQAKSSGADEFLVDSAQHTQTANDGHVHLDGDHRLGATPETTAAAPGGDPVMGGEVGNMVSGQDRAGMDGNLEARDRWTSPGETEAEGPMENDLLNTAIAGSFGKDVSNVSARVDDAANRAIGARAFTQNSDVAFRSDIATNDLTDHAAMQTVGHEMAHALAGGGTSQNAVDQEGDKAEATAEQAGEQFADYVTGGMRGPAPRLSPAVGGAAKMHRESDEDSDDSESESEESESESETETETETETAEAEPEATPDAGPGPGEGSMDAAAAAAQGPAEAAEEVAGPGPGEGSMEAAAAAGMEATAEAAAEAAAAEAVAGQEAMAAVDAEMAVLAEAMAQDPNFTPSTEDAARMATAVETAVGTMAPEAAAEYMTSGPGRAAIEAVAPGLADLPSPMDGTLEVSTIEQANTAIDAISRVAEVAGPDAARALAETMVTSGAAANGTVQAMMGNSIAAGNGSSLAAHSAVGLGQAGNQWGAQDLARQVSFGIDSLETDYTMARGDRSRMQERWSGATGVLNDAATQEALFDQESLAADREAFDQEHFAELQAAEEVAAGAFGTALNGQAILAEGGLAEAGFSNGRAEAIGTLHETNAGRVATAQALARSGAGEAAWTDGIAETGGGFFDGLTGGEARAAAMRTTVERGALTGVALAQAEGNGAMAADIVAGTGTALAQSGSAELLGTLEAIGPDLAAAGNPGAHRQAVLDAAAANGVELVDENGIPTADGQFLERLGVFSDAGVEAAAASPDGLRTALGMTGRQLGLAGRVNTAVTGTPNAALGTAGSAVKTLAGLDQIVNGSATFTDYARGLIDTIDGAGGLADALAGGPTRLGQIGGGLGKGTGLAFDTLGVLDGLQQGDALATAQAASNIAVALGAARFVGKRATGIVGLALDAGALARDMHISGENREVAAGMLAPAFEARTGVSPELAMEFAEFAAVPNNIRRFETAAAHAGVDIDAYALSILDMEPAARERAFSHVAMAETAAGEAGSVEEYRTDLAVSSVALEQSITQLPGESDRQYETRRHFEVQRYQSERFQEFSEELRSRD